MSISNKLCNPTPFDREIDYERGIVIKVPAENSVQLSVSQMADFQEGRPGSEEARLKITTQGLFLFDNDREYDVQALEALKLCVKHLEGRYNEAVARLQDMHITANLDANPESSAFQNKLRTMGLLRLKTECEKLKARITVFQEAVGPESTFTQTTPKYDPERTCFVTDPPREFPSKTALAIFLAENPEVKAKHDKFSARKVQE
jgi:hypothetical protein